MSELSRRVEDVILAHAVRALEAPGCLEIAADTGVTFAYALCAEEGQR
jgi:hypothetical protein